MPHIQMTVKAAKRHVMETDSNIFELPREVAMSLLDAIEESGGKYIPTDGCPTFSATKGCQCSNMEATAEIIREDVSIE